MRKVLEGVGATALTLIVVLAVAYWASGVSKLDAAIGASKLPVLVSPIGDQSCASEGGFHTFEWPPSGVAIVCHNERLYVLRQAAVASEAPQR